MLVSVLFVAVGFSLRRLILLRLLHLLHLLHVLLCLLLFLCLLQFYPDRSVLCVVHLVCSLHQTLVVFSLLLVFLYKWINSCIPSKVLVLVFISCTLLFTYPTLSFCPIQNQTLPIVQPGLVRLLGTVEKYTLMFGSDMH
jgi:hypothetical protein